MESYDSKSYAVCGGGVNGICLDSLFKADPFDLNGVYNVDRLALATLLDLGSANYNLTKAIFCPYGKLVKARIIDTVVVCN